MGQPITTIDPPRGYCFEDLDEGMSEVLTKTVTDADVVGFAGVTGDTNPMHLNAEFAGRTRFKGRIVHGMLTASVLSALIGTRLPGPGCAYVDQSLRFKAPVRIGDTVTARVTVTRLIPEKRYAELETVCTVDGTVVLEGRATVLVPARDDPENLSRSWSWQRMPKGRHPL